MAVKAVVLGLAVAALAKPAQGSMVQRCIGADGALTYTQAACPDGRAGEPHWAHNPPPGSVKPTPPPRTRTARQPAAKVEPSPQPAPQQKAKKPGKKGKPARYVPWRP